jgi:hypothetical protein
MREEYRAMMGQVSWINHFGAQNTLDFFAIAYLLYYVYLRILYPYGSGLSNNEYEQIVEVFTAQEIATYNNMPIMHLTAMCLMFLQVFYFFKVLNYLSKYVQLIFKGLSDSLGFL